MVKQVGLILHMEDPELIQEVARQMMNTIPLG